MFSQGTISGKITDKQTNQGLPSATVAIKGTPTSVITDNEGNFLLQKVAPGKVTLTISYIGYETVVTQVDVSDNNTSLVNAYLNVDVHIGSTVVVTASNRAEKIMNAPASISVLGVKDFEQFAGSNINEIVSKVNGIQFSRSGVDWISFNARNFNSGGNLKVLPMVDGRLNKGALSAGVP